MFVRSDQWSYQFTFSHEVTYWYRFTVGVCRNSTPVYIVDISCFLQVQQKSETLKADVQDPLVLVWIVFTILYLQRRWVLWSRTIHENLTKVTYLFIAPGIDSRRIGKIRTVDWYGFRIDWYGFILGLVWFQLTFTVPVFDYCVKRLT